MGLHLIKCGTQEASPFQINQNLVIFARPEFDALYLHQ